MYHDALINQAIGKSTMKEFTLNLEWSLFMLRKYTIGTLIICPLAHKNKISAYGKSEDTIHGMEILTKANYGMRAYIVK